MIGTHRPGRRSGLTLLLAAGLLCLQASAQNGNAELAEVDGRQWSRVTSGEAVPWPEADEFCDSLVSGGLDDWRLPTLVELEALHDPAAENGLRVDLALPDCCAWSSLNLVALAPERKGLLPDPSGPPAGYYWGFLFAGGISYYSNGRFADGFALCTRGPVSD